ncbi:Reticulon-domain-containing protein [Coniella lustricola]|uniref:Reticulon-like protein n=1 Tax=Coniella lustricola TaxID=2025994 RepID=A0A2T3A400_9PEZI|nr:Reticulon-domain-containing protein [Coniella lustricola]
MADTANGASTMDSLKANAQSAYNSVSNGPVAQKVSDEHQRTTAELSNLAAARQTPSNPAATGQPLTHYHSFFSELLSWNNPRASALAYLSTVAFIFAVRYLDVLRWGFRLTWMVLGVTIAAEVAGKLVMNAGLASQLRPRKYYTVPRETLDSVIGDVHELVNFVVIESQRILFAENIGASTTVAVSAFLSYWLVKIVPYWGLGLLATTLLFTVPLIYTTNQELIDHHLKNAQDIVQSQTNQLKEVAGTHTAHATEVTKGLVGDYASKAQQMLRGRQASAEPPAQQVRESDFPSAPKEEFKAPTEPTEAFKAPEEEFKAPEEHVELPEVPAAPAPGISAPATTEEHATEEPAGHHEEPLLAI